MAKTKAGLIVALDVDTLLETRKLIEGLSPCVDIFKVGSQLFTACGPAAVRFILAKQKQVFLDLKFHDIPNTVAQAVKSAIRLNKPVHTALDEEDGREIAKREDGLLMMTVHTSGGVNMMKAAVEEAKSQAEALKVKRPLILGVTVLTSEENKDNIQALVLKRALMAKEANCDGVVASVHEAPLIRKEFGGDFCLVTPGIRPAHEAANDQKRVATPKEAVLSGSHYLVVGRPIVKSQDPLASAKQILKEIS